MDEKEQARRAELEFRIHESMVKGEPRFLRARQYTDQIVHLLQDFIPRDRVVRERVERKLVEAFFEANVVWEDGAKKDAQDALTLEGLRLNPQPPQFLQTK